MHEIIGRSGHDAAASQRQASQELERSQHAQQADRQREMEEERRKAGLVGPAATLQQPHPQATTAVSDTAAYGVTALGEANRLADSARKFHQGQAAPPQSHKVEPHQETMRAADYARLRDQHVKG